MKKMVQAVRIRVRSGNDICMSTSECLGTRIMSGYRVGLGLGAIFQTKFSPDQNFRDRYFEHLIRWRCQRSHVVKS